jgi:hypothetical protein
VIREESDRPESPEGSPHLEEPLASLFRALGDGERCLAFPHQYYCQKDAGKDYRNEARSDQGTSKRTRGKDDNDDEMEEEMGGAALFLR